MDERDATATDPSLTGPAPIDPAVGAPTPAPDERSLAELASDVPPPTTDVLPTYPFTTDVHLTETDPPATDRPTTDVLPALPAPTHRPTDPGAAPVAGAAGPLPDATEQPARPTRRRADDQISAGNVFGALVAFAVSVAIGYGAVAAVTSALRPSSIDISPIDTPTSGDDPADDDPAGDDDQTDGGGAGAGAGDGDGGTEPGG